MNKTLICMFLFVLGIFAVVDQSWAMGKRGGSGGGSNFGQSSYAPNQFQGNSFSDLYHHYDSNNNETDDNEEYPTNEEPEGFYDEQRFSEDEFPASTTVPEPATLSLVGMGLAGLLLKKRKQ